MSKWLKFKIVSGDTNQVLGLRQTCGIAGMRINSTERTLEVLIPGKDENGDKNARKFMAAVYKASRGEVVLEVFTNPESE